MIWFKKKFSCLDFYLIHILHTAQLPFLLSAHGEMFYRNVCCGCPCDRERREAMRGKRETAGLSNQHHVSNVFHSKCSIDRTSHRSLHVKTNNEISSHFWFSMKKQLSELFGTTVSFGHLNFLLGIVNIIQETNGYLIWLIDLFLYIVLALVCFWMNRGGRWPQPLDTVHLLYPLSHPTPHLFDLKY